jgi:hypothetical protein
MQMHNIRIVSRFFLSWNGRIVSHSQ